jgi:hypothetical protein
MDERKREVFSHIFLSSLEKWEISQKELEKIIVQDFKLLSRPTLIKYLKELLNYQITTPLSVKIKELLSKDKIQITKGEEKELKRIPKKVEKVYLQLPLIAKKRKKKGKTFENYFYLPYELLFWEDKKIFRLLYFLKREFLTQEEIKEFLGYEFHKEVEATLRMLSMRNLIYCKIIIKNGKLRDGYSFQSFKRYLFLNFLPSKINFLNYLVKKLESRKQKRS